jgi:hypothetical protein
MDMWVSGTWGTKMTLPVRALITALVLRVRELISIPLSTSMEKERHSKDTMQIY